MSEPEIDVLVFDVLGTLVDEPAGMRAGVRRLDPSLDDPGVERLVSLWQEHVDREQRRILGGVRPYVPSDALDLEAARSLPMPPESTGLPRSGRWRCPVARRRRGPTPWQGSRDSPNGSH